MKYGRGPSGDMSSQQPGADDGVLSYQICS